MRKTQHCTSLTFTRTGSSDKRAPLLPTMRSSISQPRAPVTTLDLTAFPRLAAWIDGITDRSIGDLGDLARTPAFCTARALIRKRLVRESS